MSEINESKLKKFLQEHNPKAPPPPLNELSRIKSLIPDQESRERSSVFSWLNLGIAIAASFVAVWFMNSIITNLNQNPISPSIVKTQQELLLESRESTFKSAQIPMHGTNVRAADVNLDDSLSAEQESADLDLLMEEWPTMDVGEDYLAWASL